MIFFNQKFENWRKESKLRFCATMSYQQGGRWNQARCAQRAPFVCKVAPGSRPTMYL